MKKKLILPFEDHPYSLMYHYIAFPMGIIQGNAKEDITPWLCGKYINCWYAKSDSWVNKFTIYVSDIWATGDKVLIQQQIFLYPELYRTLFDEEILQFRKMLNMGYYVSGNYNEEFIPGKWSYQKKYYSHDFIIIGYDDISQEFISASYLQDGKFQKHRISYENMRLAFKSLKDEKKGMNFWKYNPEVKFELNLNRIISELSDYLRSTTSMKIFSNDRYWGMDAVRRLIRLFIESCERGKTIDIRYTRGILEHKFYMQMRINYLCENNFLKESSYIDRGQQVYRMAETVHMLAIKYNFTGNKTIVSNIEKIMNEMLVIENEYLSSVLLDLQNYKGVVT